MRWGGMESNCCGWKAFGRCGEGDVSRGFSGAEDGKGVAFVEFAVGRLKWIVIEQVAVVYCDDFCRASGSEVDAGLAVGDDGVVGVDQSGGDVGDVVPVW